MSETKTIDRPALMASLPAELKQRFEEAFDFIEQQRDHARARVTRLLEAEVEKDKQRMHTRANFLAEVADLREQLAAMRSRLHLLRGPRGYWLSAVLDERERQDAKWGDAHDDRETDGQLLRGGCSYALRAVGWDPLGDKDIDFPPLWPYDGPMKAYANEEQCIVVGIAMLLAELERRARAVAVKAKAAPEGEEELNTDGHGPARTDTEEETKEAGDGQG